MILGHVLIVFECGLLLLLLLLQLGAGIVWCASCALVMICAQTGCCMPFLLWSVRETAVQSKFDATCTKCSKCCSWGTLGDQ